MLKAKLYMLKLQEQAGCAERHPRRKRTEIGWGNQICSLVRPHHGQRPPYQFAETGNVDAVMDGGIDLFTSMHI